MNFEVWGPKGVLRRLHASGGRDLACCLLAFMPACLRADDIIITPEDWQMYDLPIVLDAPGQTFLIRSGEAAKATPLPPAFAAAEIHLYKPPQTLLSSTR